MPAVSLPGIASFSRRHRLNRSLLDRAGRRSLADVIGWALVSVAAGLLLVAFVTYVGVFHGGWDDSLNYLGAGERLNAGHALYSIGAGDRPVDPEMQAGYSVPLVSPPLVAVVWRPLAMLGEPLGVTIWWAAMALAIVASLAILFRWSPLVTGVGLAVTGPPLLFQVTGGNMNAALILAGIVAWWAFATGRLTAAAVILGFAAVAKVIPGPLCLWLVVVAGRPTFRGLAIGIGSGLVVSLAGAGVSAHLDYATFAAGASTLATPFSLAGLTTGYLGLDPDLARFLPFVALVAGAVLVVALRRHPGVSFVIASLAMLVGFNGVHFHSYALLLVAFAPLAWAMRRHSAEAPAPVAVATISA